MDFLALLKDVQGSLQNSGLDGWLLYDFRRTNDLACRMLAIPSNRLLTRRFFFWIPRLGNPVKLVHRIESRALEHLPGETMVYGSWDELEICLGSILRGCSKAAMEYSPRNAIPYISKVDAGTVELVRSFGVEVASSADLLQTYACTWDDYQLKTHLEAMQVLETAVDNAWKMIAKAVSQGRRLTERDVQKFILEEFEKSDCICSDPPICAVNVHSADPHYCIEPSEDRPMQKGDFILIDLWCKKKAPRAVYADITRMGVLAAQPTRRQQDIFEIVKAARDAAMDLIVNRLSLGEPIMGWEADQVCRQKIIDAGFGQYFTHRTGHNIGENDHGDGANIDNYETKDFRQLLPRTCFSIEPGIYLPGEFGVRLEHDVYVEAGGRSVKVTGSLQTEIVCLQ
jgi:Xaa-Pro dipeptidase